MLGELEVRLAVRAGDCQLFERRSARVQFFAAMAWASCGRARRFRPWSGMLAANADGDPDLRHAGIDGPGRQRRCGTVVEATGAPCFAVRPAGSGRRLAATGRVPEIAEFLRRRSRRRVVVEAARAIHDLPIAAKHLPKLAAFDRLEHARTTRSSAAGIERQLPSRRGGTRRRRGASRRRATSDAGSDRGWRRWRCWKSGASRRRRTACMNFWRPLDERVSPTRGGGAQAEPAGHFHGSGSRSAQAGCQGRGEVGMKESGPCLVAVAGRCRRRTRRRRGLGSPGGARKTRTCGQSPAKRSRARSARYAPPAAECWRQARPRWSRCLC